MRWSLYYDTGRVFTDDDGSWDEAPNEGVLVAVTKIGERVDFYQGADHYQLEPDGTITCRNARTLIAAIGTPAGREMSVVKYGRETGATKFERVMSRAVADWKGR